jgi:hypothetical protein
LLLVPLVSQAQDTAFVVVTVDQDRWDIPLAGDGKTLTFGRGIEAEGYGFEISGTLNPDPSIAYAIVVVDWGAPSLFGFVFGTPIVPTGPQTVVTGSIVGQLTDYTANGVSLTPVGPKVQNSMVEVLGFPIPFSLGVDVGDPATHPPPPVPPPLPGSYYTYGPFVEGPKPGPTSGPWDFLTVSTEFSLSGGSDVARLTGFASIETAPGVPDGGVGLLGALAILGVLAAGKSAEEKMKIRHGPIRSRTSHSLLG